MDEPAVAMIEMTNENTMFLKNLCERLPPYYNEEIAGMWREWRLARGKGAEGEWYEDRAFLYEVQAGYQEDMYKYLRSIGVKTPIGASNLPYDNLNLAIDSKMDFTDMHAYWDLCDRMDRIHNRPLITQSFLNPATIINTIGAAKVEQKPLVSTEWGSLWPNDWRAVDILATASYAALNDWDGLFLYAYNGGFGMSWDDLERKLYYGTVVFNYPAKMGLFPIASIIFLRGDAAEAVNKYSVSYDIDGLFDMKDGAYQDKLRLAGIPYISRLEKNFYRAEDNSGAAGVEYPSLKELSSRNKRVVSDTGELITDFENGIFILKSPRTFSFSGFTGREKQYEYSGVRFSSSSDFATFTITSMDGKDIEDSGRLLVTVVGRVRNKGQKLAPHLTKKPDDLARDVYILNKGAGPILVEAIYGEISIKKDNLNKVIRVFPLDEKGLRKSPVSLETGADDFSFRIPTPYKTIYYEIVKE